MWLLNSGMLFITAVLVSWIIISIFLKILTHFQIKQQIRAEGPKTHLGKQGTPTMGGVAIVLAILILTLIFVKVSLEVFTLLVLFLGYAGIGFRDDYLKVKKGQSQGLTFWQKIGGQFFFALFFALVLVSLGHNFLVVDFLKLFGINFPLVYIPFILFMVIGASNAVNLTDGLDGLAAGCLSLAFLALALIGFLTGSELAVFCLIISAVTLSFLYFNRYPARVFMGDVGALPLGALLAGVAALLHREHLLLVVGAIFLAEAASVIVQVGSYKLWQKRVFKMAPLHHHFELAGLAEPEVVSRFYLAAALSAILGVTLEILL